MNSYLQNDRVKSPDPMANSIVDFLCTHLQQVNQDSSQVTSEIKSGVRSRELAISENVALYRFAKNEVVCKGATQFHSLICVIEGEVEIMMRNDVFLVQSNMMISVPAEACYVMSVKKDTILRIAIQQSKQEKDYMTELDL